MKIIEVLKELPLIDKKVDANVRLLAGYSSDLDICNNTFTVGTFDQQQAHVVGLVQSNRDLIAHKQDLKNRLALTNATVKVDIDGVKKTITQWLEFRNHGIELLRQTISALNDGAGSSKAQKGINIERGDKLVRFFDPVKRDSELAQLMEIKAKIDSTLEIVNATTDLI